MKVDLYYSLKNQVFCLKNLKLLGAPTTIDFNIFCWNFANVLDVLTDETTGICSRHNIPRNDFHVLVNLDIKEVIFMCYNEILMV